MKRKIDLAQAQSFLYEQFKHPWKTIGVFKSLKPVLQDVMVAAFVRGLFECARLYKLERFDQFFHGWFSLRLDADHAKCSAKLHKVAD